MKPNPYKLLFEDEVLLVWVCSLFKSKYELSVSSVVSRRDLLCTEVVSRATEHVLWINRQNMINKVFQVF